MNSKLKVDAIKNGTVIDHIPGGAGLRVLKIIGSTGEEVTTLGMNLPTKTGGKKDLVKIEGKELHPKEVNQIALIAPYATINIIRDFKVTDKYKVEIPKNVHGLLNCPNPKCITNMEKIPTRFKITDKEPVQLNCEYCERAYFAEEIEPAK